MVRTEEAAVEMKKFRDTVGLRIELMMLNYDWLQRKLASAKSHAGSSHTDTGR